MRIINSSSTTRIRMAGVSDCGCMADVILDPPMDTSVECADQGSRKADQALAAAFLRCRG
jgi:hypothetical protein